MRMHSSNRFVIGSLAWMVMVGGLQRPTSVALAQTVSGQSAGPQIAGCPVFPSDNVWNMPIDKLPVAEHSADYVNRIGTDNSLHPTFGSDPTNGIPITLIGPGTPTVKVTFTYSDESDLGNYPIPPNALIEGGPNSPPDSDRHIILVDPVRCLLFEVGGSLPQSDGSWLAGAGIKMDLMSSSLRPMDWTSTDAAGLAILPGLLRYDEVASGQVKHAIRFTTPQTQRAYVWPARHFASSITDESYPPMGARFRLKANVDISGYSAVNQVILQGMKKYGIILSDNGGPWFFIGTPDPRWNDEDLNQLKQIKGSDFEAVDESSLQMIPDSARVDPLKAKVLLGGK